MHPLLGNIVDPVLSAFVPHENILLTHEITNKFNSTKWKKSGVALKLDMEKTYHGVEWKCLSEGLKQGFYLR